MKTTNGGVLVLASLALLASGAGAEVTAVSDKVSLDTRVLSVVEADQDQSLNTRSFTVDWSAPRRLNTKRIVATMILFW